MNTRQRLQRLREEREGYMQACRIFYGYEPRGRAVIFSAGNILGFFSALCGCMLTLVVFSHYDFRPLLDALRSLQHLPPSEIISLASSFFFSYFRRMM